MKRTREQGKQRREEVTVVVGASIWKGLTTGPVYATLTKDRSHRATLDDGVNVRALVYRSAVIHSAGSREGDTDCGHKTDRDHERRIPVILRL